MGKTLGKLQSGDETFGAGKALACYVEGGAVIGRRAYEGEA
jgi:hypothetical protein